MITGEKPFDFCGWKINHEKHVYETVGGSTHTCEGYKWQ